MTLTYILGDNGNPIPEPDIHKWAKWFEYSQRTVGYVKVGESIISTVFLGIDHSLPFRYSTWPLLWETMVFGGPLDMRQDRCPGNQEQAMAMHERMVKLVEAEQSKVQP